MPGPKYTKLLSQDETESIKNDDKNENKFILDTNKEYTVNMQLQNSNMRIRNTTQIVCWLCILLCVLVYGVFLIMMILDQKKHNNFKDWMVLCIITSVSALLFCGICIRYCIRKHKLHPIYYDTNTLINIVTLHNFLFDENHKTMDQINKFTQENHFELNQYIIFPSSTIHENKQVDVWEWLHQVYIQLNNELKPVDSILLDTFLIVL